MAVMVALVASCAQTSGTVVGPVIKVDGSLVDVTGFTILGGGVELDFVPIEGRSYDFPLAHLQEHLRTGEEVVVEWELRNDLRYALSIKDG